MSTTRLSPDSWIDAGMNALLARGPSALKAETLARDLKTTKGSFYWHFKDVPAFHDALLEKWERDSLARLENAIASEDGSPVQKLRYLSQVVEQQDADDVSTAVEPALRAWAKGYSGAANTISRVDRRRMQELSQLLETIGLSNPELARIIYAANLGMAELSGQDGKSNDEALGTLVDLMLALYS